VYIILKFLTLVLAKRNWNGVPAALEPCKQDNGECVSAKSNSKVRH